MSDVPNVLTVAGTDPSGGAGVPVDLQVFRDHRCHGLSAVAAVVWQNTSEVRGFRAVDSGELRAQLEAVFDDIEVSAVKTGMLATAANVRAVAAQLDRHDSEVPVVVDPVLAGGGAGESLAESGLVEAIREALLPRISVATPNVPEAEALSGVEIEAREDLFRAARHICDLGPGAVLVKAGHAPAGAKSDQIADVAAFRTEEGIERGELEPRERVERDVRGTGCQLSSAIAARLALDIPVRDAIEGARAYLNRLLRECTETVGGGRPVVVRLGDGCSGEVV